MDKNVEMEYKFAADGIDLAKFDDALQLLLPDEVVSPKVRDVYFQAVDGVSVRHRIVDGKYQELTTKKRRNSYSLQCRTEINVKLDLGTDPADMIRLMGMMGYEHQLTLDKPTCAVYTFMNDLGEVEVALYTVSMVGDSNKPFRTFVEVEVKGEMSENDAADVLNEWKAFLQEAFKLGEPMNTSLYEMYAP